MLVYRICNPKTLPEHGTIYTREEVLKRYNARTHVRVGTRVRFKKPKRSCIWGVVAEILDDPNDMRIVWEHDGLVPNNIIVCLDSGEIRATNHRRIAG